MHLDEVVRAPLDAMPWPITDPKLFTELETKRLHYDRPRSPFRIWYQTVEQYSERALTVPTDKLLAIAGIATLINKSYGCGYVAGLWKEDLQKGLC